MLTHTDKNGNAQIVDISKKIETSRYAVASGVIYLNKDIINLIISNQNKKGDVLSVAKIAGIMGAKKTSSLIPLCHQVNIEDIEINFEIIKKDTCIKVTSKIKCSDKTGVEMEALTAISISLLTIYDMCKAVSKEMIIGNIELKEKFGGQSGHWIKKTK
jgi:cyclic pyranopterin phosphate synthase